METGIATASGIVASALLTFMGSYWLFVFQRKKEQLAFEILTRAVVVPVEFEPGDALQVTVRSDVMTPRAESREPDAEAEYVPAGKVYGFRVVFRNPGRDPIGTHTVYVELDQEARIASIEPESMPKGAEPPDIVTGRHEDRPNVGYCTFTFLNGGEGMVLNILSVRNATPYCKPYAREKGLILQDLGGRAARLMAASYGVAVVGALGLVGALVGGTLAYGLNSRPSDILADRPEGWIVFGFSFGGMLLSGLAMSLTAAIGARRLRGLRAYWRRESDR